jgi:hypothetical protein
MPKATARQTWKPVHLGLLLVPAAAVAFVLWEGRAPREDPAQVLAALRTQAGPRLPSAAAAGAASVTQPERYDRERLHELINGAATRYLELGFERCVAAIYTYPGAGEPAGRALVPREFEIAAESHRFKDEAGARAQAESERTAAALPVSGAPATYSDGQVLLAAAGRDFLKLTALSKDPTAGERLVALAAAWRKDEP